MWADAAPLPVAQAPTCSDGVQNGGESDVDCGLACAVSGQLCAAGQHCATDSDCAAGLSCVGGTCQVSAPSPPPVDTSGGASPPASPSPSPSPAAGAPSPPAGTDSYAQLSTSLATSSSSCPAGYYPKKNSGCQPCSSVCATCSGGSTQQCTSCSGSLYLYKGQCVSSCPKGQFTYNNACVATCPAGTSASTSGACVPSGSSGW
eukprot:scaffold14.g1317.t1